MTTSALVQKVWNFCHTLRDDGVSYSAIWASEAGGSLKKKSAAQRKNLLKAAFSGQRVPQDPNDEPASVLLERIRAERAETAQAKRRSPRKPTRTAKG